MWAAGHWPGQPRGRAMGGHRRGTPCLGQLPPEVAQSEERSGPAVSPRTTGSAIVGGWNGGACGRPQAP